MPGLLSVTSPTLLLFREDAFFAHVRVGEGLPRFSG